MKFNVVLDSKEPYETRYRLKEVLDYCFETCNVFIDVVSVEAIKEENKYNYIAYIDIYNNCVITDFKRNEIEIITKNLDLDKVKAKYNPKIILHKGYLTIPKDYNWCQGIIARYLPYICEV